MTNLSCALNSVHTVDQVLFDFGKALVVVFAQNQKLRDHHPLAFIGTGSMRRLPIAPN
jgi:hypothetical protein